MLVSAGRFGVVYSVVLRVVAQYALREHRILSTWDTVKHKIKDPDSTLYNGDEPDCRFLQLAVCITPFAVDSNLVGVTRRWRKDPADAPGHAERVGDRGPAIDPMINAYRYSQAGRSHSYSPSSDPLAQFCMSGSFLIGVIDAAAGEIEDFVASHGTEIGVGIAAVAVVGGIAVLGGLIALLAALALLALALRELLAALDPDGRLGEFFDKVKGVLLDPDNPDPISRAAGVFTWRLIAWLAFSKQQGEQDYTALSYAVMDTHDYLDVSCNVNVDSVEVFFAADSDELIAFVDALLAYEAAQEHEGRAFVGYASLRFTGRTRALLGEQRWYRSCAVEVACLRDTDGGQQLIDYAVTLARNPNIGGILHWGQRNDADGEDTYRAFGRPDPSDPLTNDLDTWREVLQELTGSRTGFSNGFTRQTGLEPL